MEGPEGANGEIIVDNLWAGFVQKQHMRLGLHASEGKCCCKE